MRPGRARRPDGIPIEVWRSLGEAGLRLLTNVFNKILMTRKMPKVKLWEMVIVHRLWRITSVLEKQWFYSR